MSEAGADLRGAGRAGDIVAGKYRLVRLAGVGGMGSVYEAVHQFTKARVAVKIVHPHVAANEAARQRFMAEAQASTAIGHRDVVQVTDAGVDEADDTLYLVMEMLDGKSMRDWLADGPSLGDALDAFAAMLEPLGAAHAKGLVHRDLKPENVFVIEREGGKRAIKLLDFGLVIGTNAEQLTRTEEGLGSIFYMSPEQAKAGRSARAPSDVWSCGVMLYEILTGTRPFDGDTVFGVFLAATNEPHRPVRELRADVPPELEALVDRCLAKDAAGRPPNATALRDELARALGISAESFRADSPVKLAATERRSAIASTLFTLPAFIAPSTTKDKKRAPPRAIPAPVRRPQSARPGAASSPIVVGAVSAVLTLGLVGAVLAMTGALASPQSGAGDPAASGPADAGAPLVVASPPPLDAGVPAEPDAGPPEPAAPTPFYSLCLGAWRGTLTHPQTDCPWTFEVTFSEPQADGSCGSWQSRPQYGDCGERAEGGLAACAIDATHAQAGGLTFTCGDSRVQYRDEAGYRGVLRRTGTRPLTAILPPRDPADVHVCEGRWRFQNYACGATLSVQVLDPRMPECGTLRDQTEQLSWTLTRCVFTPDGLEARLTANGMDSSSLAMSCAADATARYGYRTDCAFRGERQR